jgi:hypothetical protein
LSAFRERTTEELGTPGSLLLEYRLFGKREHNRVLHTPADLAAELHHMLCTRVVGACTLRFLQLVVEPLCICLGDALLRRTSALSDEQSTRLTLTWQQMPLRTPITRPRINPDYMRELDRLLQALRLSQLEQTRW